MWDFSLVDPDNRRPVDFSLRRGALDDLVRREAEHGPLETARHLLACRRDGRIKLHLIRKALAFRRDNRALFESGRYQPLTVEGCLQEHVCAFLRCTNGASALVVVPRFCSRLTGDGGGLPLGMELWRDTRVMLPREAAASSYRNVVTAEVLRPAQGEQGLSLALGDILASYPVALLDRGGA